MILTNEDRDALVQIQLLLTGVIKHIAMSELEEKREQKFNSLFNYGVQENISEKSLIQEIKEMLLKLNIQGSVRQRTNGVSAFPKIFALTLPLAQFMDVARKS